MKDTEKSGENVFVTSALNIFVQFLSFKQFIRAGRGKLASFGINFDIYNDHTRILITRKLQFVHIFY